MRSHGVVLATLLAFAGSFACAGTSINTNGSPDGVAIAGFDPIAFFTQGKPVKGTPEFTYEWGGAKWFFANAEHLQQFKQDPEKWAPQYGGHCAYGVSEGYVSDKPTAGEFEIVNSKLYLFPAGSFRSSSRDAWLRFGSGPVQRIYHGDKNWSKLKSQLEAR
jgi:YHS domain-containing protein